MGGTGTGTPSVAGTGTVQDIYDLIQYHPDIQVSSDDLIHVVNNAIRTIAKRLYVLGSNIVIGQLAVAIDYDVEDEYGTLPADFWGLASKPYISTRTNPLLPLPSPETALLYTSGGEPVYYRIQGTTKIYLFPPAGEDITIKGDYFQKPSLVSAVTSPIPFNGLFDDLIAEYAETSFRGQQIKSGNTVGILNKLVHEGVDLIVVKFDHKAPAQANQVMDWGVL